MADEPKKHRFVCYPSATDNNVLLGVPFNPADLSTFERLIDAGGEPDRVLVPLPGSKYDPLVVVLHTHPQFYPHVEIHRNGVLIAHSEVRRKDDFEAQA